LDLLGMANMVVGDIGIGPHCVDYLRLG
jgi:hypothetical protein